MILLVTRSLIRWLSNSLLKFSIHTHSTIYFGKTLVELSDTMKWNEIKMLNILALYSHLLLSQQIAKCCIIISNSTFFDQCSGQISTDGCSQDDQEIHIKKGKTYQIFCKKDVPSIVFVTVFDMFIFHSRFHIIHWYHTKYVYQHLTHRLYFNIIVSISIESMSILRKMLNLVYASIPFSWSEKT